MPTNETYGAERPAAERPLAVVALGGHAFLQKGQEGTIDDYQRNAATISAQLMALIDREYDLVITHGNGPQIGQLMLQTDLTREDVPAMPLDVLVANTEGWLGYLLQQALLNRLRRRRIERFVVTVVTQVLVDAADPAYTRPTKPVGRFLSETEAKQCEQTLDWSVVEDAGRGWRRVVGSPRPQKVVQWRMIRDAARQGHIVIACGGGGIPIVENADGDFIGVEAVIDKDLTTSALAAALSAELLVILTAVPEVFVDFQSDKPRPLGAVTMQEAERLVSEGHFPPGSMGPKVEAIQQFLRQGGRRGLITDPPSLEAALEGRGGTHFVGRL